MGQIVKRKKKGRPSKADLARRSASGQIPAAAGHLDRRRSLRRRNVRYNNFIDFDDYLDEEFEEDEDEEDENRRKEKKLKLVLKLNNQTPNRNSRSARGNHARENGAPLPSPLPSGSSAEEDDSERKPLKKRKINGAGDDSEAEDDSENSQRNDHVEEEGEEEEEEGEEEEEEEEEGEEDNNNNSNQEERERKADNQRQDSIPGTPSRHPNGLPLPEKRTLELILDKLQKKDTYGVYAEPVDLDELPDYLDVIDHPMDFATVRKKLGNGSYSTMEQFESDVFLICSNAMQYNTPETIYHKQARAIQELARKKFQKLRFDIERSEKDLKSELKTKTNLLAKKPMKKPLSRTMQESLGSEFSSGATLATVGDVQNGSVPNHAMAFERPSNIEGPIEGGNSSIIENNLEKAELSSGKDLLPKLGRRTSGVDENRRAMYSLSNQPLAASESIFSTFESEIKQLVAVGLHSEYSYARSLARFAATLGPIAWKVASQRIQQALPPGFKFGRGWVGEYEPLSTPVLMLEMHTQKESILSTKSPCAANAPNGEASLRSPVAAKEHPTRGPVSERMPSLLHPASVTMSERKISLISASAKQSSAPNTSTNQQNLQLRTLGDARNKAAKQVELNLPPSSYQHDADIVAEKQLPSNSAVPASKLREISKTMGLLQSVSSKKPDKEVAFGGLSNGKITSCSLNGRIKSPSSNSAPDQIVQATKCFPKGQEQILTDPVEAMRTSSEKAQKQQKPLARSSADTSPVPSVTTLGNESDNAAVAAARAWMSLGASGSKLPTENSTTTKNQISADSLYNPTRQFHVQVPFVQGQFPFSAGMQFPSEKHSFPFQAFIRPPVISGNEGQFQNRPVIFPHLVGNDLSRFQVQPPWRGLSPHSQPKQKQESRAPDLNISFQSPGSPAKQSSGVMIDSQQPDLALQL